MKRNRARDLTAYEKIRLGVALTALLVAQVFLFGCVGKHQAGTVKTTTFGLTATTPPPNAYRVSFGLQWDEYVVVPVSSNGVPDVILATDAEVNPFGRHKVHHVFATGSNAVHAGATENWIEDSGNPSIAPVATATNAPGGVAGSGVAP